MDKFQFSSAIKELCDYYERKEPKAGTQELWFDRVKSIPHEAMKWIITKITQENDTFPHNLPGVLAALFFQWRESNPRKLYHEHIDCPDCDDGIITAWKISNNNRPYSYLFRCGRCKQVAVTSWPVSTRWQLIDDGYDPEPKGTPGKPKGSAHDLVRQVAESMEAPF